MNRSEHVHPLVLIECEEGAAVNGALSAMIAAQTLAPVTLVVWGDGAPQAAQALTQIAGVSRVMVIAKEGHSDGPPRPEEVAAALAPLVDSLAVTHLLMTAGAAARAILPRLAALKGVMALSDVVHIVDATTVVRPVHAGAGLVTVQSIDSLQVYSIRASAVTSDFPPASAQIAPLEFLTLTDGVARASRVDRQRPGADAGVDLVGARVVVSGGRGVGSTQGFDTLRPLAGALGAAVGASRAAVDAGYAPADAQVGQTGKSVAPELYMAFGISGAVQHWAGMKDSKVIVAVNKDAEAPIFQFADYGVVGDLFEVLPQLQAAVGKR